MDIHDYWNLPPLSQAVIRAAVLLPAPADRRATRTAETTCTTTRSRHEQTYKVLYARDLLHGLVLQRRLGGIEEDGILDRPALGVRLLGRRIARLGVMQPAQ